MWSDHVVDLFFTFANVLFSDFSGPCCYINAFIVRERTLNAVEVNAKNTIFTMTKLHILFNNNGDYLEHDRICLRLQNVAP